MPVNVRLSENQYYLIYEFEEPLNIQELMKAYKEEKQLRDSLPYTLHSLVDMSDMKRIPPNWLVAKTGPGLTHPRSGRMLFVGISHGMRIIIQTILKITRYDRMQFFASREEAEIKMAELVKQTKVNEDPTIGAV